MLRLVQVSTLVVSFTLASATALVPPVAAAALTKAQQLCVNSQNANLGKLSKTVGAELVACLSDFSRSKNGVTDIAACVAADRKGHIAKAQSKAAASFAKMCTGNDRGGVAKDPGVLVTDAATIAQAATLKEQALLRDLFGSDPSTTALTESSDRDGARCQVATARTLRTCQDTKLREFGKCAKAALKAGASSATELEACVLADPRGAIAKACDDVTKPDAVRKGLSAKCAHSATVLADAFPLCPAGGVEPVHACLETPVECLACKAINQGVGLAADCDILDDGQFNLTCGCGDGILDPGEQCDQSNLAGQTCESQGFAGGGVLRCGVTTCQFDTTLCAACVPTICPGFGQPNDSVTCQNGITCTFSCQGETYDVNGDPSDGCEVTDSPQGNHTISSPAQVMGSFPECDDGMEHPLFSGTLVSDTRTHELPSVVGYDSVHQSAPDWLYITPASGGFCNNDVVATLTMSSSANPSCYELTVKTDKFTYNCQPLSGQTSCTISHTTGGQFTDGTAVLFEVQKTCGNLTEDASYSVTGHF